MENNIRFNALLNNNEIALALLRAICNTSQDYFLVEDLGLDFLRGKEIEWLAEEYELSERNVEAILKKDLGLTTLKKLRKEPSNIFAKWLDKYMKDNGYKASDLAKIMGFHRNQIYIWLRAEKVPTLKAMLRLEETLKVDLSEIKRKFEYI